MARFEKIKGTMEQFLQINGPDGAGVKESSGVLEMRNSADSDYAVGRAANIPSSGSDLNDLINLLMARGRVADIEFSFDGGSPPSAGANTNKFGFCHTAGGSYSAGDIVFDTGSALYIMPTDVATHLTSRSAVSGTISLIQNCLYAREGATWTLKGDGTPTQTGHDLTIEVDYAYTDTTVSSTAQVPDGAIVTRVTNEVLAVFDGSAPTVQVDIDGTADETVMATADSKVKKVNEYSVPQQTSIGSGTTGPVKVTVTPDSSTVGNGKILVHYVTPLT